jgi:tetratricopeptide (TPR) repeat protein
VAAFVADLAEGVPVPSAGVAKPTAEVPVSQVKSETEKLQPEQESLQEAQVEAAADGEGGEAVEKTLQAIAEKPVTLQAKIRLYNVFAGGYFYQKNYVAAGKFLAEALKIDPLDPESLRNMAILCHEQGQKEKAQEYVSKLPQTDFLLLAALR